MPVPVTRVREEGGELQLRAPAAELRHEARAERRRPRRALEGERELHEQRAVIAAEHVAPQPTVARRRPPAPRHRTPTARAASRLKVTWRRLLLLLLRLRRAADEGAVGEHVVDARAVVVGARAGQRAPVRVC